MSTVARRTHCKHGHEFTPENTMPLRRGKGRECRACNNGRRQVWAPDDRVMSTPCGKCGGTKRNKDGRCSACRMADRRAFAERRTPCPKCGGEVDHWGNCRPCQAVLRAKRAAAMTQCPRCKSTRLAKSGSCLDCAKRRLAEHAAKNTPCKVCGAAERLPSGGCRPCGLKNQRWRKYGLTHEMFVEMMAAQGNKCAACDASLSALPSGDVHVDHDHETGAVRGILCRFCNTAIGLLKDSPLRARKLASYLERHAPALPFARQA